MKARSVGLVLLVVGCARARPPDVAIRARYEMLRRGPQTAFSLELSWPLERGVVRVPLRTTLKEEEDP